MLYAKRLSEGEARKLFQQLIDAVDYCHNKGVYHRDLKPENLLLTSNGNLKISDFGLSALRKPGDMLSTKCGSPSYVAPELLVNKEYDGAAADVWSCGVILFELLAGHLPFDDSSLMNLYKKISRAEYKFPEWFTENQKKLISGIFDPNPKRRLTVPEIIENEWFQKDYVPTCGNDSDEKIHLDDVKAAFDSIEENVKDTKILKSSSFINAFQLIAMSNDLDLSGLFEEKDNNKQKTNNFKIKMHAKQGMTKCRSHVDMSAEVIEVAPTHCVVEISRSAGELGPYTEFCKSLTSQLIEESGDSSQRKESEVDCIERKSIKESEGSTRINDHRDYSPS
ncbi:hypothetical protein M0R45_019130 [Rubus argutus]|uniref:non-specific serine/threonine protein kinase n=1 Tax=Rubus argutus TaxID=59490 RepID=A0AAW1X725_RUBAR